MEDAHLLAFLKSLVGSKCHVAHTGPSMKHVSHFVQEVLHTLQQSSEFGRQRRATTKNIVLSTLILSLYVARIVHDLM